MAEKIEKKTANLFSKVFIILFCVFILLFGLTSFGVLRVNTKITDFIHQIAEQEVVKLEKELGLKIQWGQLQFTLLDFSIKMEDIILERAPFFGAGKKPIPAFLDGAQYVQKISLRPSLFFLFKRQIFFNKIELIEGDFFLKENVRKEVKKLKGKGKGRKNLLLPFKKISIKNTNLNVRKEDHLIQFSGFRWDVKHTLGVYSFSGSIKKIESSKGNAPPLSFYVKGRFSDSGFSFDQCVLKNKMISLQTDHFTGTIENGHLKSLSLQSQGELLFENIKPWLSLLKQSLPDYKGQISYKLSLVKKEKRKLKSQFHIQSKRGVLREIPIKEFNLKGHFIENFFVLENGSIRTEKENILTIQNMEILLNSKALPFQLSVSMENMSTDLIKKFIGIKTLPFAVFPVKGGLKCKGQFRLLNWDCEGRFHVSQLTILADETDIISFYKADVLFGLKRLNEKQTINIHLIREGSSDLQIEASYSFKTKGVQIKFQGHTFFPKSTQFPAVDLKGSASFKDGIVEIQNGEVKVSGYMQADFLEIAGYRVKNIQSSFKYENEKLYFLNTKSRTEKSYFSVWLYLTLKSNLSLWI